MACMKDGFVPGQLLDNRYKTISPLNHGSFGMVFLAKDTQLNQMVAIKCLAKPAEITSPATDGPAADHLVELLCHERVGSHPNIVNLQQAFETDSHLFLVLEYCANGDLYEAIRLGRGPVQTQHVRSTMLQLVDAVAFLHAKGLYHRDIKPENLFLTSDGTLKLGDFGLATTENPTTEACVGSDRYMAPEQYEPPEGGYSPAQADIWAIGICLVNILFSRNPFVTPTENDVLFADFARDRQSLFDVFPAMSQATFEVLSHALTIDPAKRSLPLVRAALQRVVAFTTEEDDDIVDDFCTEDRIVVPATANRQPLRTPSIQSPPLEQGAAFPWAQALHMSPPPPRQLSIIPDIEPVAAATTNMHAWGAPADTASMASGFDSALGASIKSVPTRDAPKRSSLRMTNVSETSLSGSLPVPIALPPRALASVYGPNSASVSKSWSDLWDEEEEEAEQEDARRAYNNRNWSTDSVDEDITLQPKQSRPSKLATVTAASSVPDLRATAALQRSGGFDGPGHPLGMGIFADQSSDEDATSDDQLSEPSPPLPDPLPALYSPPAKRSVLDKWAVLGNRRRAAQADESLPPSRARVENITAGLASWRKSFGLKQASNARAAATSRRDRPVDANFRTSKDQVLPGGAKNRFQYRSGSAGAGVRPSFFGRSQTAAADTHTTGQHGTYHHFHHHQSGHGPANIDVRIRDWRRDQVLAQQQQRYSRYDQDDGLAGTRGSAVVDDWDEFEWVGGWSDLHV